MMADLSGHQIGDYRLIRLLGKGSSAEVYLAEHIHLARLVAIKLLHTHLPDQARERFLTEAKLLSQMKHPHVTQLLDYGIEDDTAYFIMDYAPLGTLRTRHPWGTRVELSTVVSYVTQIASALSYAHAQRIIHRDLKPENLLLRSQDEVLLSDFGLAALAHSSGSLSMQEAIGTLAIWLRSRSRAIPVQPVTSMPWQ